MTRDTAMLKTSIVFLAGLLAGIAAFAPARERASPAPALRHSLQVRLHRVEIQGDKLGRYADWQRFLHARHDDAVTTLEREHMYVEAMFRDPAHDPHVLYWLEVRDDAGAHSNDSSLDVDREHERYMHEVLRNDTWSILATENVLVAPFVQDAIAAHPAVPDANPPAGR
jgi:hypothetical protein